MIKLELDARTIYLNERIAKWKNENQNNSRLEVIKESEIETKKIEGLWYNQITNAPIH